MQPQAPTTAGGSTRDHGRWRSLLTTMGDVSVGIPFGERDGIRVRPHVAAGVGLIRSCTDSLFIGNVITHDDLGAAFEGGLVIHPAHHLGVRGDLRYFGGGPHFWRTSIGLVIR